MAGSKAEPAEDEDTFPRDRDALARELKRRLREIAAGQRANVPDRAVRPATVTDA
ncbi:MAG: hypothetical protein Q8M24_24925 [Pseudolabrys sp.]|nr:hypothetical protein [Pseudolabrys sp.]